MARTTPRITARVDARVTLEQAQRLDWIADQLGVTTAAVVRAWLDGVPSIDGVDLVATLQRLRFAEPHEWDRELHLAVEDSELGHALYEHGEQQRSARGHASA